MPDFFVFSKVIPLFLNPLPLILLVLILWPLWIARKKPRLVVIPLLAMFLWVISTPWFADTALTWWEQPRKAAASLPPQSDIAIVLGGMSNPLTATPGHLEWGSASERLLEALELYRDGRVGALLITSGSGNLLAPEAAEAPALAAFARRWGVVESDLLVESASRNTRENASLSLPMLQKRQVKSVVLITSAAHMNRSEAVFRKALAGTGLTLALWPVDTRVSGTPFPFNAVADPASLAETSAVLREVVGWVAYRLAGFL